MLITEQQMNDAIQETLHSMESGKEYYVKKEIWDGLNAERARRGFPVLKEKNYPLRVEGNSFYLTGARVGNIKDIKINTISVTVGVAVPITVSIAMTIPVTVAIALMQGAIEKRVRQTDPCDGKTVEIDGREYKLTLVK